MINHIKKNNKPNMVNISKKNKTIRTAKAEGIIQFSKKTFKKINSFKTKKGELNNIAIIAGILGSKKTSDLIPLCHNISLEDIKIDIQSLDKKSVFKVICTVKTTEKTGVEMEALTGVAVTCLTIYDMTKSIDKNIIIEKIKLIKKTGGKSNYYKKI